MSRRFKMGARICLLYDGFFSFAVVRQLANRLFLFMRIIIKSKCHRNVRAELIFDRKNRLNCYKARTFQKNFLKNTKEAEQLKSAPLRYD